MLAVLWPLMACLAAAQNPPTGQAAPTLETLKKVASPSEDQRRAITELVSERVTALAGGDTVAASESIRALRSAVTDATPAFKEAFAQAVREQARGQIAAADTPTAVQFCTVLGLTDSAEAAGELSAALRDQRSGVRAAAAAQLARLRGRIATAGGQYLSGTLRALVDAAKAERDRTTLQKMYEAMDFAEVSNATAAETNRAFLEVLDARRSRYAEDNVPAEGADLEALQRLARRVGGLDESAKRQYGTVLGHILRYYVDVYTTDGPEESALHRAQDSDNSELLARRDAAEKIILEAESQLNQLLGSGAGRNVSGAIRSADMTNAKIAYNAWAELLQERYGQDFSLHRK